MWWWFHSFGYIPRNGIFNFLRNLHTAFYCGYACLHSHQLHPSVPFPPHSHQNLLSLLFLTIATPTNVISLWFCFAFPQLLMILSNFSFYSSVQFSSVAQSCPTLCDPMNHSTPGLPVPHQLLESTKTHLHWVGDAIQPSHPLLSPFPPAFNLSKY